MVIKMKSERRHIRLLAMLTVVLSMVLSCFSFPAEADTGSVSGTTPQIIKIGYYENEVFETGASEGAVKSGYAYEYYQKLSEYTGWKYEYIYGDYYTLYDKLINGEIDFLAGLAYIEEREELMGYPKLPMGTTDYHLVKKNTSTDINSNPESLNGKKVGVLEGAMSKVFEEWMNENNVKAEKLVYRNMEQLKEDFDEDRMDAAMVESAGVSLRDDAGSFITVGKSDYYLCVSRFRTDLLETINAVQYRISVEEPKYLDLLQAKYYSRSISSTAFFEEELEWLNENNSLVIGYLNDFLPYCDTDSDGEAIGAITEIAEKMLSALNLQSRISLSYRGFDTTFEMIDELKKGKLDIVFPVGGGLYFAEQHEMYQSSALVTTSIDLVFKNEKPIGEDFVFAINTSNEIQEYYVNQNLPEVKKKYYNSIEECLEAIVSGDADGTTLNGFRTGTILKNGKYSNLNYRQLNRNEERCFGVRLGSRGLLMLINRGINLVGEQKITAIAYRYTEGLYQYTTKDFLVDNTLGIAIAVFIAVIVAFFLIVRDIRKKKKYILREEKKNAELQRARDEQETQLQEILSLNNQLKENQSRLEEATAEQEAQIEEITELNNRLQEEQMIERYNNSIISSLAHAYLCIYYVDIAADYFKEIVKTNREEIISHIGESGCASAKYRQMSENLVSPDQRAEILAFTDLKTLPDRLRNTESLGIHFKSPYVNWCEGIFVVAQRDEEGVCTHVLWGVRSIQKEKEQDEIYKAKLEELTENQRRQLNLVNTLSQNYLNVYVIQVETGNVVVLKSEDYKPAGRNNQPTLGYQYEEEVKLYIKSRVHPEDVKMMSEVMELSNVEKALDEGRSYEGTYRILINGETHYYQYMYARIKDSRDIVAGFRNVDVVIADEKRQKEEMRNALETAKKANAAKTTFLSRMSHDIRTPLNGIIGFLELSEKHPTEIELLADYRGKSMVAAKHLLSLVSDILELSKLDDDRIQLINENFNINELEKDVLTIASMRAYEAGIALDDKDSLSEEKAVYVSGSPLHVRQILLNILGNSIKYNKSNGNVTYSSKLVTIDKNSVNYVACITDTGIGMSAEFIEHMFEPFTQEHSDARSVYQGTGLGMSIVKSLLDKMNGRIKVTSIVDEGSSFEVIIPFEISDEAGAASNEDSGEIDITGLKILLVEDNELNIEIAETILKEAGAVVTKAYNGQEAVDLFVEGEQFAYDVILMDLMMPVLDGYEATRAIRALDREDANQIPIIAMTANAFLEDAQKSAEAGMNQHIAKPIDIKKLMKILSEFAERKREN